MVFFILITSQKQFGARIVGFKAGYISNMFTIGGVAAIPFMGPLTDTWGRRYGMFVGCLLAIMGTIIEGTSTELNQFLAGRFFLGFGATIQSGAAPTYVVEIAHPVYRGVITGLYNGFFHVGAILAGAVVRATVGFTTSQSWLIPTWVQMICPGIVCACALFIPESPRWLYSHGKREKAAAVITKYHGEDNPNSIYVLLQMEEFARELETQGADKRWWDYRGLFNTRSARYRVLGCTLLIGVFSQWSGNGVVHYYLPGLLSTVGITNAATVLDINIYIQVVDLAGSIAGAFLVDSLGRRPILIWMNVVFSIIWAILTALTGIYNKNGNAGAAQGSVGFVIIFGFFFAFGFTTLQGLYPVEVLSYEQRAKGEAFYSLVSNAATMVSLFGMPVALQNIGWKTYIIFIFWTAFQALVFYFVAVETKGRTLEEMNEIFEAKNPVKASLAKRAAAMDVEGNILSVKEI